MPFNQTFVLLDDDKLPAAIFTIDVLEDLANQWQDFETLRAYADIEKD